MEATSRLIVKNLPKRYSVEEFKKLFQKKGTVTDCKIMHTKDGRSRQFGFVGFSNEEEAQAAKDFFNGSFIFMAKIAVEFARPVGDQTISRPWSKYSEGSSSFKERAQKQVAAIRPDISAKIGQKEEEKEVKKGSVREKLEKANEDEKLQEFLSVMQPRKTKAFWANDDNQDGNKNTPVVDSEEVSAPSSTRDVQFADDTDSEDDEDYAELPAAASPETEKQEEKERKKSAAFDSSLSDLDYLRLKMVGPQSDGGCEEEEEDAEEKDEEEDEIDERGEEVEEEEKTVPISAEAKANSLPKKNHKDQDDETIDLAETGRLFLRNLPYSVSEDDIKTHFSQFGEIAEVHLTLDPLLNRSKGYGFVLFLYPEDAVLALEATDGKIFKGRLLHVMPARANTSASDGESEDETTGGSYKEQKEKKLKKKAGDSYNWNTLFLRQDTVAEATAASMGVEKGELLDRESDNMAVRMALAETHIIAETKEFLQREGVDLEALSTLGEKKRKRSDCIILVKNLPADTQLPELRALFSKFGDVGRLVIPPSKTMALVEFHVASAAKNAFRSLAYSRYHSVPLYLEWAPALVLSAAPPLRASTIAQDAAKSLASELDVLKESKTPGGTLFVKNLAFETTEKSLERLFAKAGVIRKVSIATKPHPKQPEKRLSQGFGFVEFDRKEDAAKALREMQNAMLDGHALTLKVSDRNKTTSADDEESRSSVAGVGASTKISVKNVPFEATIAEMKRLFGTFGQLKAVRIPKRFDGRHRGFAFVEYLTPNEAKEAYKALSATHLYGRHLVLDWAKDDSSLESVRDRTDRYYQIATTGESGRETGSSRQALSDLAETGEKSFQQLFEGGSEENAAVKTTPKAKKKAATLTTKGKGKKRKGESVQSEKKKKKSKVTH